MRRFCCRTAALVAVLALFLCCACQKAPPDYFAYQKRSFEADVSGVLFGETVGAHIRASPNGEWSVTYLSPDSLSGISVKACGMGSGEERALAILGDLEVESDPALLAGWLMPVSVWLLLQKESLVSVKRGSDGYCLHLSGGEELLLDPLGRPVRFDGADCSLFVMRWSFLS